MVINGIQPRVLLVGKDMKGTDALERRMQVRECRCEVAVSCQDALRMLDCDRFDLILAELEPNKGALLEQIVSAVSSSASLYYRLTVKGSCWWLPAVFKGKPCLGAGALRPAEFSRVLDEMLEEVAVQTAAIARYVIANVWKKQWRRRDRPERLA